MQLRRQALRFEVDSNSRPSKSWSIAKCPRMISWKTLLCTESRLKSCSSTRLAMLYNVKTYSIQYTPYIIKPCWAKMKRTWGFSMRCDQTCEESSAFLARCPDAVRPSNSTCHSLNLSQLLGCQPSCKLDSFDLFLQTWATKKKGPNGQQQYITICLPAPNFAGILQKC